MSGRKLDKQPRSKRKAKTMTEEAKTSEASGIEDIKANTLSGKGKMEIKYDPQKKAVTIFFQHKLLADVLRQQAVGNAPMSAYDPIYKPILKAIPNFPDRCYGIPAVAKITKNVVSGSDFSWEAPRAVLFFNPDEVEKGYTLTYKVEAPFAPDTAKRWGIMLAAACRDIIAHAKPFTLTWIMREASDPGALSTPTKVPAIPPPMAGPELDDQDDVLF